MAGPVTGVDPVVDSDEPCPDCGEPLALHDRTEGCWNGCAYGIDGWADDAERGRRP